MRVKGWGLHVGYLLTSGLVLVVHTCKKDTIIVMLQICIQSGCSQASPCVQAVGDYAVQITKIAYSHDTSEAQMGYLG